MSIHWRQVDGRADCHSSGSSGSRSPRGRPRPARVPAPPARPSDGAAWRTSASSRPSDAVRSGQPGQFRHALRADSDPCRAISSTNSSRRARWRSLVEGVPRSASTSDGVRRCTAHDRSVDPIHSPRIHFAGVIGFRPNYLFRLFRFFPAVTNDQPGTVGLQLINGEPSTLPRLRRRA